jgi:hypothetical protein
MTAANDDSKMHTLGIVVTILVHVGVIGGVYAVNKLHSEKKAPEPEKELPHIEAGLAIQSTTAAGHKTTQPQKTYKTHDKPQDISVTKKEHPEDKKDPPPDDTDPDAWKRNLKHHVTGDSDDTPDTDPKAAGDSKGTDAETKQGQANGDPRGTKLNAVGNPYEGKLVAILTSHFEAADFPRDQGLLRRDGCFSLNEDGTINLGSLELRTPPKGGDTNAAFDSAVDRAFRESEKELEQTKTAGQLEAVPADLVDGLVKGKKCLTFGN